MDIKEAYQILYSGALIALIVLIGAMLVRAIKGPRITDRIMSINMIGTMVICAILILSQLLKETFLIDVALIYAMVSLVTVLMLAAMYIPADPKIPDLDGRRGAGGAGRTQRGKKKRRSRA